MFKVFYSWQSDLPGATNRYLIQDALEKACAEITNKNGIGVEAVLDRDTLGLSGSPDIKDAILEKINDADAYVADITPVNGAADGGRPTPNPNVLFEAGYARAKLGNDAIILVLNEHFGKPELLPFDLRGLRLLTYTARPEDNDRASVRKSLTGTFRSAVESVGRAKRNDPIMELAYPRTQQVAGRARGLVAGLIAGAGKTYDPETLTEQELADVCRALNPNAAAPIIIGIDPQRGNVSGNWLAYLQHWRQHSNKLTAEVMVFAGVLEPEHIALMAALEQCAYFKHLDSITGIPLRNSDLSFIAPEMWKYVLMARRLEEYAGRVLARRAKDL
jgi:hypothetical protein